MDTVLACVHGRAMPCLNLALKCLEIEKIWKHMLDVVPDLSWGKYLTNGLTKFNKIDGCYCLIAHDSVPDGTIYLKRKHKSSSYFWHWALSLSTRKGSDLEQRWRPCKMSLNSSLTDTFARVHLVVLVCACLHRQKLEISSKPVSII